MVCDGVEVVFSWLKCEDSVLYFDLEVTPTSDVAAAAIVRRGCMIRALDLHRLGLYLLDHIGPDSPRDLADSLPFMTYDLDFEVTACGGGHEGWNDGAFAIRWMIFARVSGREGGAVRAGFEAMVSVAVARRFAEDAVDLARQAQ